MEKFNIDTYSRSDAQYIKTIGEFIRNSRLEQNKTQEQLATEAGVNRTTLSQLEKGKGVNLVSLIQLLRALKRLDVLGEMEIKPNVISPMQLAALEQEKRYRVRKNRTSTKRPSTDW